MRVIVCVGSVIAGFVGVCLWLWLHTTHLQRGTDGVLLWRQRSKGTASPREGEGMRFGDPLLLARGTREDLTDRGLQEGKAAAEAFVGRRVLLGFAVCPGARGRACRAC